MENSIKTPCLLEEINIRKIEEKDNPVMAKVIRSTLEEFGANRQGTVYYDRGTDYLFQSFRQTRGSVYYVAECKGQVLGGGGIFPSPGLSSETCELVKMYLLPEARGIGLGSKLIETCLAFAREAGNRNVYLETMPELKMALKTYEKFGFQYLPHQMGNTGHYGCDLWMLKKLEK